MTDDRTEGPTHDGRTGFDVPAKGSKITKIRSDVRGNFEDHEDPEGPDSTPRAPWFGEGSKMTKISESSSGMFEGDEDFGARPEVRRVERSREDFEDDEDSPGRSRLPLGADVPAKVSKVTKIPEGAIDDR